MKNNTRKYDFDALDKIKQIDAGLIFKKAGGEEAFFVQINKFLSDAQRIFDKFDVKTIYAEHKEVIPLLEEFREDLTKMFATTIIWDVDELLKSIKNADEELVGEKFYDLKISIDTLVNKILDSEIDENGNLIHEIKADVLEEDDDELRDQVLEIVSKEKKFIPMDTVKNLIEYLGKMQFDKAEPLMQMLRVKNYDNDLNLKMEELIKQTRAFDFDGALETAQTLESFATEINAKIASKVVKKRVLVVDDAPDILVTVKNILQQYYDVCVVTNIQSAHKFLSKYYADLVILDIDLGSVDGFEFYEKIRVIDKCESTPIMFLTSDSKAATIKKALQVGAADYLKKPIDAFSLINRVYKHLG